MNYLSTVQTAEKWGVSISRIAKMCKAGQIPGAVQIGSRWMIPEDTEKPADGRTRDGKAARELETAFRFPLFVNESACEAAQPLSEAEKRLSQAQKAFGACRFEESRALTLPLCVDSSRSIRIAALAQRCYLGIYAGEPRDADYAYGELLRELRGDFPYKRELELFRYSVEMDYGSYGSIFRDFHIDPAYCYQSAADGMIAIISLIALVNGDLTLLSKLRYESYEHICQMLERRGLYLEAQQLHYSLVVVYQLQENEEKMRVHIRRALELAQEHELYFYAGYYRGFYPEVTDKVLREFPQEFAETVCALGDTTRLSYAQYTYGKDRPSFLGVLSEEEFDFAFLSTQGYTNQQIAKKKKLSEKRVSKIFSDIYARLNLNNKQELVELVNGTHKDRGLGESTCF